MPQFDTAGKMEEYTIRWRLVTNSGQDEGVIRPVIGAKGLPFYPGSSMKGAFRRACPKGKRLRYCGGTVMEDGETKTKPGILRFHGGYPVDMAWGDKARLVDVVHSQQPRQVMENATTSANVQISLYKPTLKFGISSTETLKPDEWDEIWEIWEQALAQGIGSRVSAGYGRVEGIEDTDRIILSVNLCGQGLASQLLNKTPEFRPNMFKAALRGHTLRLLAGVTDKRTAQALTKQLWGGISEGDDSQEVIVGLLGIDFTVDKLKPGKHIYYSTNKKGERVEVSMPTYDLQAGRLDILYMKPLSQDPKKRKEQERQRKQLRKFVTQLIKIALLLGGLGKSWRRVDHHRFYPGYFKSNDKPAIGCHWGFTETSENLYITAATEDLKNVAKFLGDIQQNVVDWLRENFDWLRKDIDGLDETLIDPNNHVSDWREVWHPDKVEVWGRIAKDKSKSEAIQWFHGAYSGNKSIKGKELTGKIGGSNPQVGRIWHRMYPRYIKTQAGDLKHRGKEREKEEYVELLTIFPDRSKDTQEFRDFLENGSSFRKIFPVENEE
jgi:CRISPR-associated protein Cmr6